MVKFYGVGFVIVRVPRTGKRLREAQTWPTSVVGEVNSVPVYVKEMLFLALSGRPEKNLADLVTAVGLFLKQMLGMNDLIYCS